MQVLNLLNETVDSKKLLSSFSYRRLKKNNAEIASKVESLVSKSDYEGVLRFFKKTTDTYLTSNTDETLPKKVWDDIIMIAQYIKDELKNKNFDYNKFEKETHITECIELIYEKVIADNIYRGSDFKQLESEFPLVAKDFKLYINAQRWEDLFQLINELFDANHRKQFTKFQPQLTKESWHSILKIMQYVRSEENIPKNIKVNVNDVWKDEKFVKESFDKIISEIIKIYESC